MDKKTIRQYGTDIFCYRLRTARQKKRIQYKDFDKWLIGQHKIEHEISKQQHDLGWIPLNPPVQQGWARYFVLRAGVAASSQAGFFEGILKKINTIKRSHRKDFKVKRRKDGRKIHVETTQDLDWFFEWEFKNKLTDEEKKYFDPTYRYHENRSKPEIIYVFNEPWRFVLQVRPYFLTHTKRIDGELESAEKKMKNLMEYNDYRKRQRKILYGAYHYSRARYDDPRRKNPLKNKPIHKILDELKMEML